jgi:ABC-type nitrate/sulfonate/bicarbonate transport system ATPase subunit
MSLQTAHLSKSFVKENGERKGILRDVSFTVKTGSFFSILGQSGGGKSTLLRILGGFEPYDAGQIFLNDTAVIRPSKKIMMIFQDYNQLFPWKTVRENILYAIKKTTASYNKAEVVEKADKCLEETGLLDYADEYPKALSGGMKQRGALARALALQTEVLLMDEPFSSLDYFNRKKAQEMLLRLWEQTRTTVVFVTHDIDEALFLSQELAILNIQTKKIEAVQDLQAVPEEQRKRLLEERILSC